jgi:hypothetical protein
LSEDELLSRVRKRIDDGSLPAILARDLLAGFGGYGDMCHVCDQEILSAHVEYEVTDPSDGRQLTFHLSCYLVWQLECVRRIQRRP